MSEAWAPPAPPEEPVREGARWRWHRPSSELVAEWFATQPLDEQMEHKDYIGGLVLIPQNEKVKYTTPTGGQVERFEQVFTPYVQIGTRIGYFHRLAEQRGLIPVLEPAQVPRSNNPGSLYFNGNMDEGLWWYVVAGDDPHTPLRYLCATWRVALYDPVSFAAKLRGEKPLPVREGRGTKQVGGGPDPNAIAKAQTGAVGRALGVAGILVIGTGIACLPRRAEILTRDGFRGYDEVEVGQEVLAYDLASDRTRWTPLRRVGVYGESPMVRLHNQSFTAICTADHKWAVRHKYVPASGPTHELREATDLARGGPQLVYAALAESGDHPLSERDAAVLGWLVTDGHVSYKVNAGSPRASIAQSKPEHVVELRHLLDGWATEGTVGAGWQDIKGVRCWVRQRHDFRLTATAFRDLKHRAQITRLEELPHLVSHLTVEARGAMLDAMRKADGHWRGGGWVFTKGKRWVLDLFQMLCTLEGRAMGPEHPMATSAATQIHVRSSRFGDAAKLRMTPEFPELVWCPTTDYGTWVARLDGQVFITGNTAEDMQELPGYGASAPGPGAAQLPAVPSEIAEGSPPPALDPTEQLESLRSQAMAMQARLQEQSPEQWRTFIAWWNERKVEEGWGALGDVPFESLKGIVSRMERLHAEASAEQVVAT